MPLYPNWGWGENLEKVAWRSESNMFPCAQTMHRGIDEETELASRSEQRIGEDDANDHPISAQVQAVCLTLVIVSDLPSLPLLPGPLACSRRDEGQNGEGYRTMR
jgi:hypothetical protein